MEVYEYMESVKRMPRVLLAGANSGCGKTSITCGILKALVNRGLHIQSYKCGPDYIDPMLHSHITGRDCRNLDPFFSTGQDLRYLVGKDSQDVDFSVTHDDSADKRNDRISGESGYRRYLKSMQ